MEYKCDDRVVYGINGVCRIVGIENLEFNKKTAEYYILESSSLTRITFYVPTQNPTAVAKMRKTHSVKEMNIILDSAEVRADGWIADEAVRKVQYKALIARGQLAELISMNRALNYHKQHQIAAGKKNLQSDEQYMKDAEWLINSEVSYVFDIPIKEVGEYICGKLGE